MAMMVLVGWCKNITDSRMFTRLVVAWVARGTNDYSSVSSPDEPSTSHQRGGDVSRRFVKTSHPFSVIMSSCSNWADRFPSSVTAVLQIKLACTVFNTHAGQLSNAHHVPSVGPCLVPMTSYVDHRFYCKDFSYFHNAFGLIVSIVWNIWSTVEQIPNAMTTICLYNAKTFWRCMFCDYIAKISVSCPRSTSFNCQSKALHIVNTMGKYKSSDNWHKERQWSTPLF